MDVKLSQIIAPHFFALYKIIKHGRITGKAVEKITEAWLRGGRGSTKSSFISIVIILGIMADPEANAVAFRRFENEVRDSVFAQLKWAINKLGVDHLFKEYTSPFKLVYLPTGQVILFKGADNPKKIKSIKFPKGYCKYAWFEEVDQFGGLEEMRNILQSVFRGTTKHQLAFFSYNPPKSARSWANAETKIEKVGRVVHYSDYRTVPPEWLGQTFLDNAEHLKHTNEDAYNHEYLGMETGTGLEVFKNVTIRAISDKEIEAFDHINQGLDFGYTIDPLSFEVGNFDSRLKKLYLFREISGTFMKNKDFAGKLSQMEKEEVTMADSASPKDIADLREEYGVNVVPADKIPGGVDFGIKYLQDLEEIIIDPARCPLAAKEFINYALNVDRNGNVITKYPDADNHSIDATRYMMSLHIIQARKEQRKNKFQLHVIPKLNRW